MRENRVDEAWLARHVEEVLEPTWPIIDAHHHARSNDKGSFLFPDISRDLGSGHDIRATVFVEGNYGYRSSGPEHFKPVGEIEFASALAQQFTEQNGVQACAALVGYADLSIGAAIGDVLEAQVEAAAGRLRGIRVVANYDAAIHSPRGAPAGLLRTAKFREGFAKLAPLRLSYDAIQFGSQLPDVIDLAAHFPDTNIILNHCGMPLLSGPYAATRDEVMEQHWRNMRELAQYRNVSVKLGGLGIHFVGLDFWDRDEPASSQVLAAAWRPFIEPCIELFGAERCMFESNFPVDKTSCSYRTGWNAFKRMAVGASAAERDALFQGTARRVYCIA